MTPVYRLRWLLIVILIGLWSGAYWPFPFSISVFVLTSILLVYYWWPRFWVGLCFIGLISSAYGQFQPFFISSSDSLTRWHQQTVALTGTIRGWPEQKNQTQVALVDVDRISDQSAHGRLRLRWSGEEVLTYGQQVAVTGKLTTPRSFADFDYPKYLRRFGVQTLMDRPTKLEIISHKTWWKPAVATRQWFEKNLHQNLPSPQQELAAGVLIGTKSALPEPSQTYFKTAGLQHLIVVSGSNVAILIFCLSWLFRRLGPHANTGLSLFFLAIFVFITGAEPPVLRAGIFGLIMILTQNYGRQVDIRNLLLLAAVCMGLFNPLIVQSDLSFWLSFMATAGIILGWPIYQYYTQLWPVWEPLRLLFGVSLVAQLAVFPLLIATFEVFPWVGLVTNLLAEPLVPLTMATSLVAGVSGIFPGIIAQILALPALVSTSALNLIAHLFGPWPGLVLPSLFGKILLWIWSIGALWALFSNYYQKKFWEFARQNLDDRQTLSDHNART